MRGHFKLLKYLKQLWPTFGCGNEVVSGSRHVISHRIHAQLSHFRFSSSCRIHLMRVQFRIQFLVRNALDGCTHIVQSRVCKRD